METRFYHTHPQDKETQATFNEKISRYSSVHLKKSNVRLLIADTGRHEHHYSSLLHVKDATVFLNGVDIRPNRDLPYAVTITATSGRKASEAKVTLEKMAGIKLVETGAKK